ncbi:MAG: hypothetical protein AAB582_00410 [Patescibacteria group bacterium]
MTGFIKTHERLSAFAEVIKPRHIAVPFHAFGKAEIDENAGHLVSFFQEQDAWVPFEMSAFKEFCTRFRPNGSPIFYGLVGDGFDEGDPTIHYDPHLIRLLDDGRLIVTDRFILRCSGMSSDRISGLTREIAA